MSFIGASSRDLFCIYILLYVCYVSQYKGKSRMLGMCK